MELFVVVEALIVIATFFVAYVVFETNRQKSNGKPRSFALYFFGLILSGFIAAILLIQLALNTNCTGNSGALCAFGVVAIVEPIAFIAGVVAFIFTWAKVGKHA